MTVNLTPADYIRRTRDLRHLVQQLRGDSLLAIDTESNSLYAYYEQRVSGAAFHARSATTSSIPWRWTTSARWVNCCADPATEIIFHAAEYDVITLKRDYGFTFANIFDTMLAARICGWPQTGLGNILVDQFDVRGRKEIPAR